MTYGQNLCCGGAGELRWLILDEADRLLDLGFEAKLKAIIEVLDQKVQEVSTCGREKE